MSQFELIPAMIDVVYSDACKAEMKITDKTDNILAHNIIQKIISKYSHGEISITVPTNTNRYSDVSFDFKIDSKINLEIIINEIKNELPQTLSSVDGFTFPPKT